MRDYSLRSRIATRAVLGLVSGWGRQTIASHEPQCPGLESGGSGRGGASVGIWKVDHRGTGVPFLLEVCQPQGLPPPESTLCLPAPDLVLPAQHSAKFRLCSFAFFMSVFKRILEAFPERIFCFRMVPELRRLRARLAGPGCISLSQH